MPNGINDSVTGGQPSQASALGLSLLSPQESQLTPRGADLGGKTPPPPPKGQLGWPDALRGLSAFLVATRRPPARPPSAGASFSRRGAGRGAGPLAQPGALGQFIGRQ